MGTLTNTPKNDFYKIIAVATMLIDHIGAILFPEVILLRIIGRLAMPVFAFGIANGAAHTNNIWRYTARLAIFGLISQIPYGLLFSGRLNIFLTLLWGLFAIVLYNKHWTLGFIMAATFYFIPNTDYGIYGTFTILSFYALKNRPVACFATIAAITFANSYLHGNYIQMFCLAIVPFLFANPPAKIVLPKYFFYAAYPAHLAVLLAVKTWVL